MSTVATIAPRPRRTALAVSLALMATGCTIGGRLTGDDAPSVSAAGASVTRLVSTALVENATLSLALDRIDQRELPLDRRYRHFGTGRGVTVYVFDGGVLDTHPELAGRVRRGFDAFPGEELCNAHGTAVAGAVAGASLGVAADAEIVDVKMVECRRMRGTIDAIVRGTQWVLADHARTPGTRAIANWSFIADTTASIPALDSAAASLRAAGIPVIVSAGNVEMDACRIAPANAPGVVVVGASRVRRARDTAGTLIDDRAPGTAYGACIDLFAPGDSVLLPGMDVARQANTQLWTGTSMAAGYVSGAVALYLEGHPFASPDEVASFLSSTAGAPVDAAHSPRAGMVYVGTDRADRLAARVEHPRAPSAPSRSQSEPAGR